MREIGNEFFGKLSQSLSGTDGQLQVMESKVPIEKQLEFFRIVNSLKTRSLPSVDEQIELLDKSGMTEEDTNIILASLAVSCDVKAFRALERFREGNSCDFADMACMQARMMLQSEFSDKHIIFISTGLGGRDDKLRYTALFRSNRHLVFSAYQRDLIEKEIPYYIGHNGGEVEEIELGDNYFVLVYLQEITGGVKLLLDGAIGECNRYGDFIDTSYLVTNVRRFCMEDVERELRKHEEGVSDTDM
ncbi:MAG: hypothetical protein LBF79_06185 [Dysgonamonadaceae bacterium]|jgi:hypothetical protein|nr:hypothetical protein [Dysgonamonadaceae bacterium]